jgi:bifunctional ADP-heptose synthase (sugar kinase/adenylyltransferase)
MLRVDRAPQVALSPTAEARVARELQRAARGARAVLASDYGSGSIGAAALDALRALRKGGLPVCVDSRYRLVHYTGLTMLKPNELELEAASGMRVDGPAALERAARAVLRRVGCAELLVTRARHGMSLFRKGHPPVHIPPHGAQEAVDVTGAGDTVAAAYTAAIAAGADAESAARLANVAGALKVQKAGTATVSRGELLAEIETPEIDQQLSQAIAAREQAAAEQRAKGAAEAQKIKDAAERQQQAALADANSQAQAIKGEGDGKAAAIAAQAYGRDPDFYRFYQSMQAYRESIKPGDVVVVDSSSDFFRFMRSPNGEAQPAPAAAAPRKH